MDGVEGMAGNGNGICHQFCHCLAWAFICVTCPISVPLMGLCWCCQMLCPVGPEACLGDANETTGFLGSQSDPV